jgi:Arc/MetJ-type ribon-helix-helix transcriptional regulator
LAHAGRVNLEEKAMTITLTPDQEKAVREAIQAGLVRSVDELIEVAIQALPHREDPSARSEAIRRMQEFGEKASAQLGRANHSEASA